MLNVPIQTYSEFSLTMLYFGVLHLCLLVRLALSYLGSHQSRSETRMRLLVAYWGGDPRRPLCGNGDSGTGREGRKPVKPP